MEYPAGTIVWIIGVILGLLGALLLTALPFLLMRLAGCLLCAWL